MSSSTTDMQRQHTRNGNQDLGSTRECSTQKTKNAISANEEASASVLSPFGSVVFFQLVLFDPFLFGAGYSGRSTLDRSHHAYAAAGDRSVAGCAHRPVQGCDKPMLAVLD